MLLVLMSGASLVEAGCVKGKFVGTGRSPRSAFFYSLRLINAQCYLLLRIDTHVFEIRLVDVK